MSSFSRALQLGLSTFLMAGAVAHVARADVIIKMGSLAPEGSIWHDALLELRQQWRELSGGEITLRIYAGGVLGDEVEMVRKMQRRGLDALAISGSGLPSIESSASCLNIPLLFSSYEELDYVRQGMSPILERRFEQRGFRVLNWAEAGWVYFFATAPVRTPDDLRELRLWLSTGSPETERLFKSLGFKVVPLPATDMLTSLQTGLIEAIDVPPLFALIDRSYQVAKHMTDLKFAPLNAATVITLAAWRRIPDQLHAALVAVARRIAADLREQNRAAEQEALAAMQSRGLSVVRLSEAERAKWLSAGRAAYPQLLCSERFPELFQRALALHREVSGGE